MKIRTPSTFPSIILSRNKVIEGNVQERSNFKHKSLVTLLLFMFIETDYSPISLVVVGLHINTQTDWPDLVETFPNVIIYGCKLQERKLFHHKIRKWSKCFSLVWWMGVDYELIFRTLCTRSDLLVIHFLGYTVTPKRKYTLLSSRVLREQKYS